MSLTHVLHRIKGILVDIIPDVTAILYGSQARGEAREDSDIDVLVLVPNNLKDEGLTDLRLKISSQLYYLSLELGVDISPVVVSKNTFYQRKTPFTLNVMKDGIEL